MRHGNVYHFDDAYKSTSVKQDVYDIIGFISEIKSGLIQLRVLHKTRNPIAGVEADVGARTHHVVVLFSLIDMRA